MKPVLWISLGVVVSVALVVIGLAGGWALWGRHVWPRATMTRRGQVPGSKTTAAGGGAVWARE